MKPFLLSAIVFTPWLGALALAALPRAGARAQRALGLAFSLSTLALAAWALRGFDPAASGFQLAEDHPWIGSLGIRFGLGLDGLSLVLVLLTGLVAPAGLLASWRQEGSARSFGILFLVLQGAALGVFLTLDFVPWFLFWELSLVPAYFLIRLWGGPGGAAAAYQFFVYTIGGSAFMLLGFAAIFAATGVLNFPALARMAQQGELAARLASLGGAWPAVVFGGIVLGFAVKVPLFPCHTWLPSAYAEAPTGGVMMLTGVMSKMGVYGFLRIVWPLFPGPLHAVAPALLWLALAGAVFGSLAAVRQTDLKRMAAYSSLNHVSYCLVAVFAVAAGGAGSHAGSAASALGGCLLLMFSHGISAAAMFAAIGFLEARAGGRRGLDDFGGVISAAPRLAWLGGFAVFCSIGLPGLSGFIAEFLIFRGVWGFAPGVTALACLALFATAYYLLTFWQRVFQGPRAGAVAGVFPDLSGSEVDSLLPLAALMLIVGVMPQWLTGLFNPLIARWLS